MRFSPSSLSVFRDCARCFWIEQRLKIKRPRGIFPSLPGGIDRVMKAFIETCVAAGDVVPHLAHFVDAFPHPDRAAIKRWQNWRTGITCEVETKAGPVQLSGAIDDLIVWADGRVSPWDFKTKGSAPKEGDSERYYGAQLDIYAAMIASEGLECTGEGMLTYLWPKAVFTNMIEFEHQTVILKTDPERAFDLVRRAADCLAGNEPEPSPLCEQCQYLEARANAAKAGAVGV